MEKVKKEMHRSRLIYVLYGFFVAFGAIIYAIYFPTPISNSDSQPKIVYTKIGLITDIHASRKETRQMSTPGNIVYPSRYKESLGYVFGKMKEGGAELVINLGDSTNSSSQKHATEIKNIGESAGIELYSTKGNHDTNREEIMRYLGAPANYYYFDKGEWRFVIVDSSEAPGERFYVGGIGDEQFKWLEEAIDADKNVFIAMHHPIWEKDNTKMLAPEYKKLEAMIVKSRNVKFVAAGHWHVDDWNKIVNGIEYYQVPALTLGGSEGNYKIIKLPTLIYSNELPKF